MNISTAIQTGDKNNFPNRANDEYTHINSEMLLHLACKPIMADDNSSSIKMYLISAVKMKTRIHDNCKECAKEHLLLALKKKMGYHALYFAM